MSLLGWYPWRCNVCRARFYLRRKITDPYVRIGPPAKRNSDERQGDGRLRENKIAQTGT